MKPDFCYQAFPIIAAVALMPLAAVADDGGEAVRQQADSLVRAMEPGEARRDSLIEEVVELHNSTDGPIWRDAQIEHFGGAEGAKRIRDFMQRHGFRPEDLEWLDAGTDGGDGAVAVSVRLLHARKLLREGPPRMDGHWPEWDRGETPGEDAEAGETSELPDGAGDPDALLESFVPKNVIYRSLLNRFAEMSGDIESLQQKFIEIPEIEDGDIVNVGDRYEGVNILAKRLKEEGYLEGEALSDEDSEIYTEKLSEAVKRFQRAHGRSVDGILGPNTLAELNRGPKDGLEILRINLHRARLMPDEPGERHIIVNLPSTRVFAFDGGDEPVLQMKVIVGEAVSEQQTPIFRDVMETLEFGPPWNVPTSIASRDIVPRARDDHGYLARNNYEIVSSFGASGTIPVSGDALSRVASGELFIRQKPGPNNALGSVKFLFPNDYAIYLHDTPDDELFEETERDFSNGCIRVEDPAALAEYVLGPQGWDRSRVEDRLENATTEVVEVEDTVNVYIVYFTAFPEWEEDGKVRFYPDLYEQDKALR